MKVIGVTGGTGAGKTTALSVLAELGALVIDCDEVYHRLLREDRALREELTERFGDIGTEEVDRKKLGKRVFGDPKALEALNRITHRCVSAEVRRILREHESGGGTLAAIDAIALIESGLGELCDHMVYVTAPEEIRARRIMERENISMEYAMLRIRAQKPDEFFRAHCDTVLVNDRLTPEAFKTHCKEIFQKMIERE